MSGIENSSLRILAVDDEEPILSLFETILANKIPRDKHYDLVLCADEKQAIEAVEESIKDYRPFNLAFIDVYLNAGPVGIRVAKQIRDLDSNIQIVIVSGNSGIDIKEISKAVQPPDKLFFLQKPFGTNEIIQFVNSLSSKWQLEWKYGKIINDLERSVENKIEELVQKEKQYEKLIESNADAIIVLDTEGIMQYMNSAAESLFVRKRDQFVGQYFGNPIISGETEEIEIIRGDGLCVVGEMRSVISEWNGRESVVASIRDITHRKEMEFQLSESLENLKKTMRGTVQAMAAAVEKKDPYTSGHQASVERISVLIAKKMGLSDEFIERLSMAALLHDIGKISVPVEILIKPIKLTDIEFKLIKAHSQIGYDIIKKIDSPWNLAEIIIQHHERPDGSGYPYGLRNDEILLEAKIIGIADTLDAISSHRPYRASLGQDFAMNEVTQKKGELYDSEVVDAYISLYREKKLFANCNN